MAKVTNAGLHNKKLGIKGEKKARRYLKLRFWKILEKNFKCPFGEVDIIAKRGRVVAFVEVKTRLSDKFGMPSEAVNAEKRRRYVMCAKYYFSGKTIDCTVRFDIIEVFKGKINYFANAFEA